MYLYVYVYAYAYAYANAYAGGRGGGTVVPASYGGGRSSGAFLVKFGRTEPSRAERNISYVSQNFIFFAEFHIFRRISYFSQNFIFFV